MRGRVRRQIRLTGAGSRTSFPASSAGGRMKFNIPCPKCNGQGRISNACSTCHGEGVVSRSEPVEFRIKTGTRNGQRIRLQGKGNAGVKGGAPGALYLIVRRSE